MSLELRDRLGGLSSNAAPVNSSPFQISNNLTGYQAISNIGNGNTFYYLAVHRTQNQWEVGLGQIQISGLFTYVVRSAANVFDGTNGPGVLTSFALGDIDIVSAYPAALISALNYFLDGGQGFLVNVAPGEVDQRSLQAGQAVSIENASGVSGNPIIHVDSTGFPPGVYGSGTQIPSFTLDAAGRIIAVSLAPVGVSGDVVTSIDTSVSSYLGHTNTSGLVSIYLDVTSLEGRFDTLYASLGALASVANEAGASIANTNAAVSALDVEVSALTIAVSAAASVGASNTAALVSVNAALTSVTNSTVSLASALTSVNNVTTSINAVTTSIGGLIVDLQTSIGNSNSAITSVNSTITSINAATARLAAANAFTSINSFGAPTSVSTLFGSGPVQIRNGTWTPPAALTDAASIAVDMSRSNDFVVTLGGSRTVEAPTHCQPGQSGTIFIHQDGTGGRTLAWNGVWKFPASTAPTLTATSSARDTVAYEVYTSTIIVAGALLNT